MFSKEESRKLRETFWISFGKSFPRKWVLYDTKIKGLSFKFHFDLNSAMVVLDLEDDLDNRINCWEKLQSLKPILLKEYLPNAIFKEEFLLDNGKDISRVYVAMEQKVSIHDKNSWRDVMVFFNETMSLFEDFFFEYRDFLES